ncbi:hypothetical protein RJ641_018244 [Dillenia turbinata]|uniref:Uncharacterized protein n=1 Tax=Dillenia turbinata TaxID=194707 RepID=A0AAN8Z1Q3_9MAGN
MCSYSHEPHPWWALLDRTIEALKNGVVEAITFHLDLGFTLLLTIIIALLLSKGAGLEVYHRDSLFLFIVPGPHFPSLSLSSAFRPLSGPEILLCGDCAIAVLLPDGLLPIAAAPADDLFAGDLDLLSAVALVLPNNFPSIFLQMSVYARGVSVLMPGEVTPTFIAHPAPMPCPQEQILWPLHQPSSSAFP